MTLRAEACYFRAADGGLVHFDVRDAGPVVRGTCLMVHGLGEHLGKYEEWFEHAVGRGYNVTAYDQRGHGRTRGRRGDFLFGDLVADLERFVAITADRYPGLPVFVLGHSLGALVALAHAGGMDVEAGGRGAGGDEGAEVEEVAAAACLHPALRGFVLSGPPIVVLRRSPERYARALRPLARLLPWLPLPRGTDFSRLTRDTERAAAFRRDPLIHRVITPRAVVELARAIPAVRGSPERITVPVLFLVARADEIVSGGDVLAYAHFVASGDVTIEQFPSAYHELLNDLGRRAVFDRICDWMDEHAG